ncbi:DNA cytosine methyltransferase [Clostridium perfringens]|uniref:Cytosine-specific methyltransferase n=2 Tax=Clostridium perfringens TaxID=1502 RepID=A0AAW9I5B5_CLOPF|nr:DNA cytosine methyltransferase [Clostridium perfringens]ABG82654.1 DNA-cytosine methyltransferase [Clostridium perfringens ATCC 13124]EGT0692700.1 DNA cytosine methyltransferase [Clostridium perfringens]EIF6155011.1 DNA cytosine methyltransferase [Clostridium perfringens]MBI5988938.1 DNA cytosine methyltransferase [Clostridium perfringens]MBI6076211.1 DNA cytosine methyltransferase [Clostridium perfringens]
MSKIAISFFAGAGGLDIGIHEAGFDVKLSVELEEKYCVTLKQNNPTFNVVNGDIMDYSKEKIYSDAGLNYNDEIDLIFGGSPCQSFSTAGKRQAFSDERGKAMLKFIELIEEVKPKAFLLENVKGLLSATLKHRPLNQRGKDFPPLDEDEENGSALRYLLNQVKDYNVVYKVLNSAEYGVAQKRERVIFVGIRKDLNKVYEFPNPTHGVGRKYPFVTVNDVIQELGDIKHNYVKYSEERLKYMKLIPKGGGNWRDLNEDIVEKAMGGAYKSGGGKTGYFRRIKANEPSPTLLTSPIQKSTNIGHPYEDRPLSIEEYIAIQGFPKGYKINGTINNKYTQIGNAVPVKLAKVLGEKLIDILYE